MKRVRRTKAEIAKMNEFFVKEVQSNKELLFGALSPTVTAAKKDEKWKEIRQTMVTKGDKLLANKNAHYVKTTFWQMIRGNTMDRVDALKVTTGAEPNDDELTAVSLF